MHGRRSHSQASCSSLCHLCLCPCLSLYDAHSKIPITNLPGALLFLRVYHHAYRGWWHEKTGKCVKTDVHYQGCRVEQLKLEERRIKRK